MQDEPSLLFVTVGLTRVTCPEAENRKWQGLIDTTSFICVLMCVCRGGGEGLVSLAFQHVAIPQPGPHGSHQSPQFRMLPQILGFQARHDCEIPQGGRWLSLTLLSPGGMGCTWGSLFMLGGHRRRNLDTPALQFFRAEFLHSWSKNLLTSISFSQLTAAPGRIWRGFVGGVFWGGWEFGFFFSVVNSMLLLGPHRQGMPHTEAGAAPHTPCRSHHSCRQGSRNEAAWKGCHHCC